MTCPNINSPEWKALVNKVGGREAMRLFRENDEMPNVDLIKSTLEGKGTLDSIQRKLRGIDYIDQKGDVLGGTKLTPHEISLIMDNITGMYYTIPVKSWLKDLRVKSIYSSKDGDTISIWNGNEIDGSYSGKDIDGTFVVESATGNIDYVIRDVFSRGHDKVATDKKPRVYYAYQEQFAFGPSKWVTISWDTVQDKTNEFDQQILLNILSENGIKISTLDHYMEVTGDSRVAASVAAADIGRKIIAVNEGKMDETTLPEEAGHFVIEQSFDTYEVQRSMKMVEKTPLFNQHKDAYLAKYEGDLQKVKKEVLGKILGQVITNRISDKENKSIIRMLKKLWNNFKALWNNTASIKKELDRIAGDFLSGRVNISEINSNEVYFQLETNKGTRGLEDQKKLLSDIIKSMELRVKSLSNRHQDTGRLPESIQKMKRDLEGKRNEFGFITFLKMTKQAVDEARKYIDNVRDGKATVTARKIMQLGEFISFHENHLTELKAMLKYDFTGYSDRSKEVLIENTKDVLDGFNDIREWRNRVRIEEYLSIVRDIYAEELGLDRDHPNLDDQIIEMTGYDFVSEAREVHKDSHTIAFWFGSLRDARDGVSKALYAKVKRVKQKVFEESLDFGKRLTYESNRLGIRDFDIFFEREFGGKRRTGYFIEPYRMREWSRKRAGFFAGLNNTYNLSPDFIIRAGQIQEWETLAEKDEDAKESLREYRRSIGEWYRKNTMPLPDSQIEEIIAERKKQLNKEEYEAWEEASIGTSFNQFGDPFTYYKGELTTPSDGRMRESEYDGSKYKTEDWTSPIHQNLTDNQREFLSILKEEKKRIDAELPGGIDSTMMPQVSEKMLDIFKNKRENLMRRIGGKLMDDFSRRKIDDDEFGMAERIERPDGSISKYVPIFYNKLLGGPDLTAEERLKETDKISTDLISMMVAYKDMAENFKGMAKIAPEMELIQEQVASRKYVSKKGEVGGLRTTTYKRIEKFVDMNVFGERLQSIEGTVPDWVPILGGRKINWSKVAKSFGGYVRSNNLAWNFFTTASNYIQSRIYLMIEGLVGQYTTKSSAAWAEAQFYKNILNGSLIDLKNVNKTNKMNLLMERFELFGDTRQIFSKMNVNRLTRKALDSGLYWSYELVDYFIKSKVMLAMLNNYRLYDGKWYSNSQFKDAKIEGIEWNDLETAYSKIQVSDPKSSNGKQKLIIDIPDVELRKISSRIEYVANQIDGRLTPMDYAAAHQNALGMLSTIHRSWLFSGISRRFKHKGFNMMTSEMDEGYFRTTGRWIADTFFSKEILSNLRNYWSRYNELEIWEKKAVARTTWEVIFSGAVMVAALTINKLADEEDDYILDVAAYLANRALMETAAFLPPIVVSEFSNTLAHPLVPMRQVELMFDLTDILFPTGGEEVTRGQWKGYTKRQRAFARMTPIWKGLALLNDPSGANQFLKNKPLRSIY